MQACAVVDPADAFVSEAVVAAATGLDGCSDFAVKSADWSGRGCLRNADGVNPAASVSSVVAFQMAILMFTSRFQRKSIEDQFNEVRRRRLTPFHDLRSVRLCSCGRYSTAGDAEGTIDTSFQLPMIA